MDSECVQGNLLEQPQSTSVGQGQQCDAVPTRGHPPSTCSNGDRNQTAFSKTYDQLQSRLIGRFLSFDPDLTSGQDVLTCDHLCHDNLCRNPWHIDTTAFHVNISRNGSDDPAYCFHWKNGQKCIMTGTFAHQGNRLDASNWGWGQGNH